MLPKRVMRARSIFAVGSFIHMAGGEKWISGRWASS
jgi:hypothetical protein